MKGTLGVVKFHGVWDTLKMKRRCMANIYISGIVLLLVLNLTGCSFRPGEIKLSGVDTMRENAEKIMLSLETRDAAALKALFSKTVQNEVDLDPGIDYIFNMVQGQIEDYQLLTLGEAGTYGWKTILGGSSFIEITTDIDSYTLIFYTVTKDTTNSKNLGIEMMGIYRTKDWVSDKHEIRDLESLEKGILIPKNIELILSLLEKKDSEGLRDLFSEEALENAESIDECISYLLKTFNGDVLSFESAGYYKSDYFADGARERYELFQQRFYVETTEGSWFVYFSRYTLSNNRPDRMGLQKLQVIPREDEKSLFRWGDNFGPGIFAPGINDIAKESLLPKLYAEKTIEILVDIINQNDVNGLLEMFSPSSREENPDLKDSLSKELKNMKGEITDWSIISTSHLEGSFNIATVLLITETGEYICKFHESLGGAGNPTEPGLSFFKIHRADDEVQLDIMAIDW